MRKIRFAEKKNIQYLLCAFIIPACIMIICLFLTDCIPFGDKSLIMRDAQGQYLDFLSYTKTIFQGENDLFYSFAKGMGGDFLGLAAYYVLSPFNILFAFASYGNIVLMFEIVVILKIACSGMLFYYASSKVYGNKASLLMFSTAYALMAYNIVYEWNIMWLDGPMILPMIWLGIYKIWTERKYFLYIVSLFYGLFSNYYIGFMLCMCSVLIFAAMLVLQEDYTRREKAICSGKYILASCISGFGSAFIWLPALLSLSSERTSKIFGSMSFSILNPIWEILSKFSIGAISPYELEGGMPNIFCTTAVLFLVLLFFMNSNIHVKKRIVSGCLVLILLLSFSINSFDSVWHGFSRPHGFNFRYSFVFSFLLIFIAQYQFFMGGKTNKKHVLYSTLLLLCMFIFIYAYGFEFVSKTGIFLNVICLAGIFLVYSFMVEKERTAALILSVLCIFESAANGAFTLKKMITDVGCLNMGSHYDISESSASSLDYIKTNDDGFYRMEKKFHRSHNDPMFFNYNGLSHFSSTDKKSVIDFLGKMGLRDNNLWAYFNNGTTNEAEAFLGIKYIVGGEDISQYKNYELYHDNGETRIYKNNSVLPMAFISDKDIIDFSMDNEDFFALHNEMWSAISGETQNILIPETNYEIVLNNVRRTVNADGNTVYIRINSEETASVCYEITASSSMPLYYYFTAPLVQAANVYINGVNDGQYFWLYRWDMSNAGIFSPGEKLNIEIVLGVDELIVTDEYFYYEDLEKLSEVTDKIKNEETELIKEKSSKLTGHFSADEDSMLLFTIPYNEGWTLEIDGEKSELKCVMDVLMAAEIDAGEHSFTLRYIPVGMDKAVVLTAAAAAAGIIWFLIEKKKCSASVKK